MVEKHDTARELNASELNAATGGHPGKFRYFEMNGDTWATNGTGKPVQVTHNAPYGLGWFYGT
jgi:hypothetical protein